jgi:hypothetical protein
MVSFIGKMYPHSYALDRNVRGGSLSVSPVAATDIVMQRRQW